MLYGVYAYYMTLHSIRSHSSSSFSSSSSFLFVLLLLLSLFHSFLFSFYIFLLLPLLLPLLESVEMDANHRQVNVCLNHWIGYSTCLSRCFSSQGAIHETNANNEEVEIEGVRWPTDLITSSAWLTPDLVNDPLVSLPLVTTFELCLSWRAPRSLIKLPNSSNR